MGCSTIWAIFSETHLAPLANMYVGCRHQQEVALALLLSGAIANEQEKAFALRFGSAKPLVNCKIVNCKWIAQLCII
jgi:hypothetical protein